MQVIRLRLPIVDFVVDGARSHPKDVDLSLGTPTRASLRMTPLLKVVVIEAPTVHPAGGAGDFGMVKMAGSMVLFTSTFLTAMVMANWPPKSMAMA
jgi:hypothetical protein